jgi:hypothetical protein
MPLVRRQAQADGPVVEMLDGKPEMGGLREMLAEESHQLGWQHHRHDAPALFP